MMYRFLLNEYTAISTHHLLVAFIQTPTRGEIRTTYKTGLHFKCASLKGYLGLVFKLS